MENAELMLDVLIQSYNEARSLSESLSIEMINCLCDSDSVEIRASLARTLVYHNSDTQAIALLCKLSQDVAASVRVEAVDSLSNFINSESFDILCRASTDKDYLVRAYAAFGIAYVGKRINPEKALQMLRYMSLSEKCERVFVDIYEGLYILGRTEMLNELINLFYSSDYHVQCATLNALDELVYPQNVSTIYNFVRVLDSSIYVSAVACAIKKLNQRCLEICRK